MNSLDAFKHRLLDLPKAYGEEISFVDFLKGTLSDYIDFIKRIDEGTIVDKLNTYIPSIETLCNNLIKSFEKLYLGFPSQSYHLFEIGIKAIEVQILKHALTHPLSETKYYVRARSSNTPLQVENMFHLPFQLRELATSQRFSIPGFPCLYLSSSSYTCWEELNRPSFDNFYISRFEINEPYAYQNLRTLDISETPQKIRAMLELAIEVVGDIDSWDDAVLNYLIKWPLIFSSSIKVRYGDRNFKPEYVVPQYLLTWVRENGRIDAIKYFSIKTHLAQNVDHSSFWNVVIPVREIKNDGFCTMLTETFKLTETICLADIDETLPKVDKDVENYIMNFRPDTSVLLTPLKDFPILYTNSKFGRADIYLCKLLAKKVC